MKASHVAKKVKAVKALSNPPEEQGKIANTTTKIKKKKAVSSKSKAAPKSVNKVKAVKDSKTAVVTKSKEKAVKKPTQSKVSTETKEKTTVSKVSRSPKKKTAIPPKEIEQERIVSFAAAPTPKEDESNASFVVLPNDEGISIEADLDSEESIAASANEASLIHGEEFIEELEEDTPAPKKKRLLAEIVRFVVVGAGATIIDFVVELFILWALGKISPNDADWKTWVYWAVAVTIGFLVSTAFNYSLSFLWVFQNVDKKKTKKSPKALVFFTFLSFLGLLIGIGLQELGTYICQVSFNIDLGDLTKGFMYVFKQSSITVFAFMGVFVIKTCVTLVYNFLTRKIFIFKAPAEKE